MIASVFVENIGGGVSLRQLTNEIRTILSEDAALLARFDAVFYATLGASWFEAMEERFDAEVGIWNPYNSLNASDSKDRRPRNSAAL